MNYTTIYIIKLCVCGCVCVRACVRACVRVCFNRCDSTKVDSLGRLVNDDHITPNCTIRKIVVSDEPHLFLFAL